MAGSLPGVPVFLSSADFLSPASLERSKSPADYFTNRFLRIFPALWCCLRHLRTRCKMFWKRGFLAMETLLWLLGQISFVQFFNPEFLRGYGTGCPQRQPWTITVELQFCLLLPLLYAVLLRKSKNDQVPGALLVLFFLLSALLWTLDIPRQTEKWLQVTFLPTFIVPARHLDTPAGLHELPLLKGSADLVSSSMPRW